MTSLSHSCYSSVQLSALKPTLSPTPYRDEKFLCTWFGEVCYSCSLTVLPGSAWVVLIYVLQINFFTSVRAEVIRGWSQNCSILIPFRQILVKKTTYHGSFGMTAELDMPWHFPLNGLNLSERRVKLPPLRECGAVTCACINGFLRAGFFFMTYHLVVVDQVH